MVIPGKGNDVAQRTCTIDDCKRAHIARGMCSSHYGTWHRQTYGRNDQTFTLTCCVCGHDWVTRRAEAKYCSVQCKGEDYRAKVTPLPSDHPVMLLIAEAKAAEREARRKPKPAKPEWRTPRECPGCGGVFCPIWTPTAITCSRRCQGRVHRWRRRALEAKAVGTFTWSEFMRVAQKFGYRCAYCGVKPGQLDPDHVVPLSRGGLNSTTNLLPACNQCNGDKRDLLLDEWAVDRERRGLPGRATSWAADDSRYRHLTEASLKRAA